MSERTELARQWATEALAAYRERGEVPRANHDGDAALVRVAMGDPQAPFEKVLAILEHNGLLSSTGLLRSGVQLVSMGDHFDWGGREVRQRAGRDALLLLGWLASHSPEQAILLAGNHDLARVGELAGFDDQSFERAQAEADSIYWSAPSPERDERERMFLKRYPGLPSVEIVARDNSTFMMEQHRWVESLLSSGRFRMAFAPSSDFLLTHAGVTADDLASVDVSGDAGTIAKALNEALSRAFAARREDGRLVIEGLHHPGDAAFGEGRGVLFHRPAHPDVDDAVLFKRPWARRFDPRRLPRGLTQAIGHINDAKCRMLLGEWADNAPPRAGVLRHLQTDGERVAYAHGPAPRTSGEPGTMLFLDGRMLHCEIEQFELLDLDTRQAYRP